MVKLFWCALLCAPLAAEPVGLSSAQLARLRKSGLVVLLPGYLPRAFRVSALDLNSQEYRVSYQGPKGAQFSVWGRKSGVADGGPARQHFALKHGPFRGEMVEYEDGGFYTGFLRLKGTSGDDAPSFDVEGRGVAAPEAVKIVESLRRL